MTKKIRRILSLCLVVVLCVSMALTASADSSTCFAEEYGGLHGQCYQNADNPYILNASTSVTRNNNGAYLKMSFDFWSCYGDTIAIYTYESEPGDLLLSRNLDLHRTITFDPERVFAEHDILDPVTHEILYSVFTFEVFSFGD